MTRLHIYSRPVNLTFTMLFVLPLGFDFPGKMKLVCRCTAETGRCMTMWKLYPCKWKTNPKVLHPRWYKSERTSVHRCCVTVCSPAHVCFPSPAGLETVQYQHSFYFLLDQKVTKPAYLFIQLGALRSGFLGQILIPLFILFCFGM